jgi:hypothetical protein
VATSVQAVIGRARILLNDAVTSTAYRWATTELLKWLNDGQRFIVVVRPDVAATTYTLTLVDGTKQTLPADGLRLLDVVRNTTTNKAVRYVDRHILDTSVPDWHAVRTSFSVTNWVYDNRVPLTFYVYPPAKVGTTLDIVYSKVPTPLLETNTPYDEAALLAQTIALPDIYAEPLLNYVLFRAYSKETEAANNPQLATAYMALLSSQLGMKTAIDVAFSPERHDRGAVPNEAAVQGGSV